MSKHLTTDPKHPGLKHGSDDTPVAQQAVYLVLSDDEIAKGYVKPYRTGYTHKTCGGITTMGHRLSATYARNPWFYGSTYCVKCAMHRRLSEFTWEDGEPMDPREWPASEHERIAALRAAETVAAVPYPEFCRHKDKCAGLGCCPRDPACCE